MFMEFKEVVKQRYAAKEFSKRLVSDSKFKQLQEIIRLSASSSNVQPWRIKIVTSPTMKKRLRPVSQDQKKISSFSHLLVFCADISLLKRVDDLEKLMVKFGSKRKSAKAFNDNTRRMVGSMGTSQKLSWASRQTYIAVSNAINGAKSLGLDSCPMEGFSPKEYHKILSLPNNLVPVALVAVGYAVDIPRKKLRFSGKDVFI